ncbi:2-oxo-4-hydroxy-4-carboxy-5-ureidoimidazoline decarboxylase [Tamaricihabitans halophyticus]|uniref:2-oxo-4-hydroxy-4-carboxy-5-ureidoimidazoline decarboxylase n=1 Tax=Tamaricihabitans halophyticus TaxID=1262583 RepID=A0A4R2R303_9PSEU|nr:2-oxo-4-hydroxy-4-carboxy-5-ureidoimidazoline decarboxylase [Tamaricihabitans halophyticus]TCP56933.1 2-oxo-4-hydroxy-4-carboxy-5-ureidoimidazoline decarboxylase [Tamaricihabitans halophyticus]
MGTPTQAGTELARFNQLTEPAASAELRAYCDCAVWATRVAAERPYRDVAALASHASAIVNQLGWTEVQEALAGHPRIGERPSGTGRSAELSSAEQSDIDSAETALVDGNHQYEQKFGHVFLIRARGRDAAAVLAELERRLHNDPETERIEVRHQLAEITEGRLREAYR